MRRNIFLQSALVLAVSAVPLRAVEIVVTDRIGDGSLVDEVSGALATGCCNGGSAFPPDPYGSCGMVFTAPANGTLSVYAVSVHGGGFSGTGTLADPYNADWFNFDYEVRVWSSVAAYFANPVGGDLFDPLSSTWWFHTPTNADYLDQTGTLTDNSGDVFAKHVFEFDLSSFEIPVNQGQEYVIAFIALGGGSLGTAEQSFSLWNDPPPASDVFANSEGLGPDFLNNLGAPFNHYGARLTMDDGTDPANIPAVSAWGVAILTLLTITSGTILIRPRHM